MGKNNHNRALKRIFHAAFRSAVELTLGSGWIHHLDDTAWVCRFSKVYGPHVRWLEFPISPRQSKILPMVGLSPLGQTHWPRVLWENRASAADGTGYHTLLWEGARPFTGAHVYPIRGMSDPDLEASLADVVLCAWAEAAPWFEEASIALDQEARKLQQASAIGREPGPPLTDAFLEEAVLHLLTGETEARMARMNVTLSRQQVREVDRIAIEELGIPGVVLMENAALGATSVALKMLQSKPGCVAILCGGGNNGGDGYAIARMLANKEVEVKLLNLLDIDALKGDALLNRRICERMNIEADSLESRGGYGWLGAELSGCALIIDGLLGTGFRGEVRAPVDEIIKQVNAASRASDVSVLALDLPSGLDCDSGQPAETTIRATRTVTFVAEKRGFASPASRDWTGEVSVASIGAPPALIGRVRRELPDGEA